MPCMATGTVARGWGTEQGSSGGVAQVEQFETAAFASGRYVEALAIDDKVYSPVLSCKQCGANPEDVLMRVAKTPVSEIASLTPWAWQAAPSEN